MGTTMSCRSHPSARPSSMLYGCGMNSWHTSMTDNSRLTTTSWKTPFDPSPSAAKTGYSLVHMPQLKTLPCIDHSSPHVSPTTSIRTSGFATSLNASTKMHPSTITHYCQTSLIRNSFDDGQHVVARTDTLQLRIRDCLSCLSGNATMSLNSSFHTHQ